MVIMDDETAGSEAGGNRPLPLFVVSVLTLILALYGDGQHFAAVLGPLAPLSDVVYLGVLGILLYAVGRTATILASS